MGTGFTSVPGLAVPGLFTPGDPGPPPAVRPTVPPPSIIAWVMSSYY